MDEQLNENVELTGAGKRAQQVTVATMGVLAVLLKVGLLTATIANPIAAGATIFSSFLPSLFAKKKPQVATLAGFEPGGSPFVAFASVLGQVAALLTAIAVFLHSMPPDLIPMDWQPTAALMAAAIAAILPGLQKLRDVFRGV